MATNISIKGKTQKGDSITTTVNYVNPEATNEQLQSLASALNALTTNTIADVTRIDKTSLTNSGKSPRNLTIINGETEQEQTNVAWSTISTDTAFGTTFYITSDSEITLNEVSMKKETGGDITASLFVDVCSVTDRNKICFDLVKAGEGTMTATLTFTLPETSIYEETTIQFTIT